jgi:hypothetical protein
MKPLVLAVAATLALPVLALAALIGMQEYRVAGAQLLTVPVRGVDPRDLLQGHYLVATFDWDWQPEPAASGTGGLCVLSDNSVAKPQVHFIDGWKPGSGPVEGCRLVIFGKVRGKQDGAPAFAPTGLDDGYFAVHLFVPETRAVDLQETVRQRPDALTVDLAVRPDGSATVRRLRLDGQPIGK